MGVLYGKSGHKDFGHGLRDPVQGSSGANGCYCSIPEQGLEGEPHATNESKDISSNQCIKGEPE